MQTVRWFTTSTGKYYLACGERSATQVRIFSLDPEASGGPRLTPITTYSHGTDATDFVFCVAWLPGIDDLNYLAIGGDLASDNYQVRILRFDGSCLFPIFNYATGGSALASEVDWLATSSTMLGISSYNTALPVQVLGFSPTRNILQNNTITNVRGGTNATAFAADANNLPIDNIAYNNDTNYYYKPEYGDTNIGIAGKLSSIL
jgi:hypothetical protein